MGDHAEEQEMEAEALAAIFDTLFSKQNDDVWAVDLYPETTDAAELEALNYVACRLIVRLSAHYPEELPELSVEIIKGLAAEHVDELLRIAHEEAQASMGSPSIFAIAERLREWLLENNVKGLDDVSMHAQMMRKRLESAKAQEKREARFESQKEREQMTEAEREELEVCKRRAEGTPCNKENFEAWKANFERDMGVKQAEMGAENDDGGQGKAAKKAAFSTDDTSRRMTGAEFFSSKTNNVEALEAAAEEATSQQGEDEDYDGDDLDGYDEDLFDDDDDVSLEDIDSDDEEVDI